MDLFRAKFEYLSRVSGYLNLFKKAEIKKKTLSTVCKARVETHTQQKNHLCSEGEMHVKHLGKTDFWICVHFATPDTLSRPLKIIMLIRVRIAKWSIRVFILSCCVNSVNGKS